MFYIVCLNITPTPLMTEGRKLAFLLLVLLCHRNESFKSHWLPGRGLVTSPLTPLTGSGPMFGMVIHNSSKKCCFVDCLTSPLRHCRRKGVCANLFPNTLFFNYQPAVFSLISIAMGNFGQRRYLWDYCCGIQKLF